MAVRKLSTEEVLALPPVTDLKQAGLAWGIGLTKAAEMVRNDEFPCKVLRLGRYYRVRKADLLKSLGLAEDGKPLAGDSDAA